MAREFKFPDVGEGIEEGEIVKWFVKIGDHVKENQIIGQIETDKAVVDMPSPASGVVLEIKFREGQKIKVGQVMIIIGEKGEKISKKVVEKENKKSGIVVGEIDSKVSEMGYRHQEIEMKQLNENKNSKIIALPAVRKKAKELDIYLVKVNGSGKRGEVLMKDIMGEDKREEITQQTIIVKKKYDDYGYIERIPLKGIRKTIATHMLQSVKEAPQVTSMEDIDVSKLWKIREEEKNIWKKKEVKLTFLPFIIKACISSIQENPLLNSSLEGEEIIIKKYVNIGIATETGVGLIVPVIKIAQNKSIIQLAKEISDLTEKARKRKIDIMDLKGGTFTITNYGSIGGNYCIPIINYPEAAILGLGRIFDRAVLDVKGELKNLKILPVSLTFDHRILDGAQAARFLVSLKKILENPDKLLQKLK